MTKFKTKMSFMVICSGLLFLFGCYLARYAHDSSDLIDAAASIAAGAAVVLVACAWASYHGGEEESDGPGQEQGTHRPREEDEEGA